MAKFIKTRLSAKTPVLIWHDMIVQAQPEDLQKVCRESIWKR